MRKKIVAANWKMNMTQAESARFIESFLLEMRDLRDVDVVIIPPFTAIAKVTEALGKTQDIKVGAQNMHWKHNGAFTGEISGGAAPRLVCSLRCPRPQRAPEFVW